jgi:hypothetical protein
MCKKEKQRKERLDEFRRKVTHDKAEPKGAAPTERPSGTSGSSQGENAGNAGTPEDGCEG